MADRKLDEWYVGSLRTMVAAAEASEGIAAENAGRASAPDLRAMLKEGSTIAGQQTGMIKELLAKAGGRPGRERDRVLDAIIQAGRDDLASAGGSDVADMAVVATTRVGLHYYIAAYEMLGVTARHLGREDDAATIAEMVRHMKQKDDQYSKLAESLSSERVGVSS